LFCSILVGLVVVFLTTSAAAELKFEKDTIKADADKKPPRELGYVLSLSKADKQ
jgi:hypothetical protein